jgi:hypothetical protein
MILVKDIRRASYALLCGLARTLARTIDMTGDPQARALLEQVMDAIPDAK